ncbi:MAG TPA: ABC transporter family substrate-binding protein [Candidatus Dormibacteraeota bacterium]|nr:ABC transporter family substrate-binding protein [Candidatus Dormibacteraeota bacterium]
MAPARWTWSVGLLVSVAIAASACGGSGGSGSGQATSSSSAPAATAEDINPTDRSLLQDGGTLRFPIDNFPVNFNGNELDGTNASGFAVLGGLLPSMFNFDAAAQPMVNTDYITSGVLTAKTPKQVVTYRINPKAIWYDGTPITEADFEAQWKALRGVDPAYKIASSNGYEKIESVAKGSDDHEVVVTFAKPYVDWTGLFGALYPASTNSSPSVFNDGWKVKPLTTAGPFKLGSFDLTAKTITLVRNEKWWGRPAKLDQIIFRVIDPDAQIDSLANGEIDFMDVGPDVNKLKRAQGTAGITIRRAGGPNFRHLTMNGTSPILSDVTVRKAVAMSINRATIAKALLGPLGVPAVPLGNHIFMENQKGYHDNSGDVGTYDPTKAGSLLDGAGWKLSGTQRSKAGKPLELRIVIPSGVATSQQESELMLSMLAAVGIKLDIMTVPVGDFFDKYITPGDFDLTVFSWLGGDFPISSSQSIYAKPQGQNIQQNYARIGSDQIDMLFGEATAEFDTTKAIALGNQIDGLIWQEVHSLTLYQRPELIATKSTLANFGATGFATPPIQDIGFVKK